MRRARGPAFPGFPGPSAHPGSRLWLPVALVVPLLLLLVSVMPDPAVGIVNTAKGRRNDNTAVLRGAGKGKMRRKDRTYSALHFTIFGSALFVPSILPFIPYTILRNCCHACLDPVSLPPPTTERSRVPLMKTSNETCTIDLPNCQCIPYKEVRHGSRRRGKARKNMH